MTTIAEYLKNNHEKIEKINSLIDELRETIDAESKKLYDFIINKEDVAITNDVDALVLVDDLKFLIKKLNDYDYDLYLLKKIVSQLIIVDEQTPNLNLKELEEDFYYYDTKIKEVSNGC